MEKLKAKHDHKLTDILKVAIFGLMLILPGLILLPSMLYYGVNEHATAPTEQVEKIEYERVNFNQLAKNGNFINDNYWNDVAINYNSFTFNNNVSINFTYDQNASPFVRAWQSVNCTANHSYYLTCSGYCITAPTTMCNAIASIDTSNYPDYFLDFISINSYTKLNTIITPSSNLIYIGFNCQSTADFECYFDNFMLIDLTQMFGEGNEPTLQEFNSWYTNEYYEYTESRYEILEKPTGTYETYTDITRQIQYNWNSLWQQPIFSWTNYTILKQGLDNFTYVFGITQTSYINNLIVYELIIVAIYIVIDIVLTLFKWLTHIIGEK